MNRPIPVDSRLDNRALVRRLKTDSKNVARDLITAPRRYVITVLRMIEEKEEIKAQVGGISDERRSEARRKGGSGDSTACRARGQGRPVSTVESGEKERDV